MWPKHVAVYADYNTINIYMLMYFLVVFLILNHQWVVTNILKILKRVPFVLLQ
jgi:hypothetical protein